MSTLKKWGIAFGSLVVIIILTVIGGDYYYQKEINGYPDTKQFSSKIDALSNSSQQKTVLIFHKPDCPDCRNARSTIKRAIKHNSESINYIVINTKKEKARKYLAKYDVTQVPTVIVLKGDKVVDSSSSTNNATIANVAAGD